MGVTFARADDRHALKNEGLFCNYTQRNYFSGRRERKLAAEIAA